MSNVVEQYLTQIQDYLKEKNIDAWVVYQFIDLNPIYKKLLPGDKNVVSRRTFLIIPQKGEVTIFHSSVDGGLGELGFREETYTSYEQFTSKSEEVFSSFKRIAMEFSPNSAIPHISKVDAGIIDFLRTLGLEIVSSGDILQIVAKLTDKQVKSHLTAAKELDAIRKVCFDDIQSRINSGKQVDEYYVQQFLMEKFRNGGFETIYEPDSVINENAARSHYAPSKEKSKIFHPGDLLLIDMWMKLKEEDSIYADITWNLFYGKNVPTKIADVFDAVTTGRDKAIEFMQKRVRAHEQIMGWEVDKVARDYIETRGYGKYFTHRLGHSIGTFVHGELTHLDNYENKDSRLILENHITSVEPGVYLPGEFGIRNEVDVLVTADDVIVTTDKQDEIYLLHESTDE